MSDLKDFVELSLDELKFFLQQRGQPYSGTHGTLAARALVAHEQNLPLILTKENIVTSLKQNYTNLLSTHNLPDPGIMKDDLFSDDLIKFPSTNIGQVFEYILRCKAFSTEYVGQYKVRKAFSFFMSGFVDTVNTATLSDKRLVVKSSVIPSQRLNDERHNLWIVFDATGRVVAASCSCVAGLCQCCNHVVAVLYKISYANEKGLTDPACTEIACAWNSSAKRPEPFKIKDMTFIKHVADKPSTISRNSEIKHSFDPRPEPDREISADDRTLFLDEVKRVLPNAVLNISHAPSPSDDIPPSLVDIASLITDENPGASPQTIIAAFNNQLSFKDSQISELEKATRNQSQSITWASQREGRITASNFHDVFLKVNALLRKGGKPVQVIPLIQSLCHPRDISDVPAIQWGRLHEKTAAEAFMKHEGFRHSNPRLDECGLFLLKSHPYIGATPENIFRCKCSKCDGMFCVEYKCPFGIKNEDVRLAWKRTTFLEEVQGNLRLKRNHKYYTQVIGQLALTGCKSGYFVVWTTVGQPFIEVITFDENHWSKVLSNLIVFSRHTSKKSSLISVKYLIALFATDCVWIEVKQTRRMHKFAVLVP